MNFLKLLYISPQYSHNDDAGPKAKIDIEKILNTNGFDPIKIRIPQSKFEKLLLGYHSWNKVLTGVNHAMIVLQYPLYSRITTYWFLNVARKKKILGIALIHDIESLRHFPKDNGKLSSEINILNRFTAIIAHNLVMKKWLVTHGVTKPIFVLNLFDYLSTYDVTSKKCSNTINFAGNLEKSRFLKKKFTNHEINTFGKRPSFSFGSNINYMGDFSPNEIIDHLNSGYGLIWDGDDTYSCIGNMGNYLKYNNPHKASMYIRAGIPIIIWDKAALAPFIKRNKLGISISSLNCIDDVICDISPEQYKFFSENCLNLSKKLQSGFFTLSCINQVGAFFDA